MFELKGLATLWGIILMEIVKKRQLSDTVDL
jgi:hypothetical protein